MALTYRSPIEEVLTYLEPSAQSLIAATATTSYQQSEKENFEWFNYSLSAVAKEHLSHAGIYLSPYSGYPHSHPVCKTLENYLLYKVLPSIVNNSFYFVGIKQFKLNFLKKRFKDLSMINAINRYVSSADKLRYGNEFVVRYSAEARGLRRHSLIDSDTLRDLMPNIPTYSNLFLHDELHYWSKEQLITFLEVCKPQTMLGTMVYPTELFVGSRQSLNPWCYEYEIKHDRLLFYPDGVRAEGYDQPVAGGYLLKANKVQLLDGTVYCVDILCSKFSHHLVSLTRGELVVPKYRSFGPFEAVHAGAIKNISRLAEQCFPVSHHTILRVYRYLRSLKKPDKQSAMAKFSQLNHEPSGAAIKFMEELSGLIIETDSLRVMIKPELIKQFFGSMGKMLPACLAAKVKATCSVCLDEFIAELKPLSVDLTLQTVSTTSYVDSGIFGAQAEDNIDLPDLVDVIWTGAAVPERVRTPYIGMADLSDREGKWRIAVSKSLVAKILCELYIDACFDPQTGFSMRLREYVDRLIERVRVGLAPIVFALGDEELCSVSTLAQALASRRKLWAEGALIWFRSNWITRATVHYLESPIAVESAGQMELMYMHTPRRPVRYTVQAYGGENFDLDDFYSHWGNQAGEYSRTQSISVQGAKQLKCACSLAINKRDLVCASEYDLEYTDNLQGWKATWFSKNGAPYEHAGVAHKSRGWPTWLSLWMELNEIDPKYDCMLALKSEGDSSVEPHGADERIFADRESVHIVNLEGEAEFGLSCTQGEHWTGLRHAEHFEVPAELLKTHKYSVRSITAGRISFTFRVLQHSEAIQMGETVSLQVPNDKDEDFNVEVSGVTISCNNKPKTRKFHAIKNGGGGDCFWLAMSHYTGVTVKDMKLALAAELDPKNKKLGEQLGDYAWTEDEGIIASCKKFGHDILVYDEQQQSEVKFSYPSNSKVALIRRAHNHFEAIIPLEGCTLRALAECVGRRESEVIAVLAHSLGSDYIDGIMEGRGIAVSGFASCCKVLGVRALLSLEEGTMIVNAGGAIEGCFSLTDGHAIFHKGRAVAAHRETNVHTESVEVTEEELLPIIEVSTKLSFTPSVQRAEILSSSLLQGSTGVLCSELYNNQKTLMPERPELATREIHVVLGTFGCGKSQIIRRVLRSARSKAIVYVSPRRFLCDDFQREMEACKREFGSAAGANFKSLTFEKALLQASCIAPGALVLVDEVQLFPPGFISLLSLILHKDVRLAVFGDPCQSDYDSEKDRAVLGALEADIVDILQGREYKYNIVSHRFLGECFRDRLPCMHGSAPTVSEPLVIIEGLESVDCNAEYSKVCLVSSFEEKKIVQAYFGSACKALTFGESTGANFNCGSILITQISTNTNERRWITALSRFRKSVALINATGVSMELVIKIYSDRFLGHFLKKTATVDLLKTALPGSPKFTLGFGEARFGADDGKREEKLQGDPWLKTMVDLLQVEDQEIIDEAKVILQDEWFKTHLPQCELEGVRARWVHKILAKEHREKRMGYLVSEQFTDEHSKQPGKQITNAAERFEAIYPRHRASDTVTFVMAVRKRLRFSNPVKEASKLNQAMPYGPFLLSEFLKHVPLKPMHDKVMMAAAKFEFEEKKTSKSAATIENHSNRSMREWAVDIGLVFSKSQLCTKFDNRFRDAKAAQTIVCFQHAVLCRFAPYMRYIEKKLNEVLPSKFYIHSGKGLDELNDWVIQGGFNRICTESDYEAFDASQDQYIVAFEVCLMRYLGLPVDLIEDYKFIKTHLGSKLGSFAIMRFSGEASTFLFNTMANMLFTFLQYELKGDERICFAGDDMCSNKKLHVSNKHTSFLKKLKLKAKVAHTSTPTFCGWNLCPDGIFKKPQLVLERLCIAKEMNNLVNCIDNYAIEVAFAYKMGEKAKMRMTEEEVEAFYNCVRIIVKNKHLLKSDVLQIYQTRLVM